MPSVVPPSATSSPPCVGAAQEQQTTAHVSNGITHDSVTHTPYVHSVITDTICAATSSRCCLGTTCGRATSCMDRKMDMTKMPAHLVGVTTVCQQRRNEHQKPLLQHHHRFPKRPTIAISESTHMPKSDNRNRHYTSSTVLKKQNKETARTPQTGTPILDPCCAYDAHA